MLICDDDHCCALIERRLSTLDDHQTACSFASPSIPQLHGHEREDEPRRSAAGRHGPPPPPAGDLAGARRMLGCMERAGCPPGVTTFGAVVAGCVAAGDVDAAREAIRRGLRWDVPALSELVGTLRGDGHLARARGLLLDVLRDGCAVRLDVAASEQLIGEGALCPEAAVVVGETPTSLQQLAIIPGN